MAFYKDITPKTRQQKRDDAIRRGGFDDEGTHYRDNQGRREGNHGSHGKPGYRPEGDRGFGPKKDFHGKPDFRGEDRGFGPKKDFHGKPDFRGEDRGFGPKKDFHGKPDFRGEERGFGPKKDFHGKPDFRGEDRGFGPKKDFHGKPDFRGEDRGFGPKKDFHGKPDFRGKDRSFGPKKDFHGKPDFRGKDRSFGPKAGPKPVRENRPEYESFRWEEPARPEPVRAMNDRPRWEEENAIEINENLLSGRNPIREALKAGRDIEKLMIAKGELSGSAREIVAMAKDAHIPVQEVERARLDAITPNHQGMLAFASAYRYSTLDNMLKLAEERGEEPFLILLDGVTDPHNLGAVIRSAECAGAHGVIVQERRAVGLTPAAVKASAGAVEYLPVARVTNLGNVIEELKARNIWVYAADMSGEDYSATDLSGAVALVIGAEGEGVGHRVLELCDKTVSLPIKGHVDSLNASVAAGILMYAVMQAR